MSNVILYRTNEHSFENWNLCCNRKRCMTRAWPLAPGTIIFQRSFMVRECTDRNDRSVLDGVSSTFAESLIVTNDLSAVARIAVVHDVKGHMREFIKSRVVIECCLLLVRCKPCSLNWSCAADHRHDNRSLSHDEYGSCSHIMQHPFRRLVIRAK